MKRRRRKLVVCGVISGGYERKRFYKGKEEGRLWKMVMKNCEEK